LKSFLIHATRLKMSRQAGLEENVLDVPLVPRQLKEAVELHFRSKHAAGDYAALLGVSLRTLAKATRRHIEETPSELIAKRIVLEAKRDLYLTNDSVKEIAFKLGFKDELYFSRFFKKRTKVSPRIYRETVGFGR